MAQAVPIHCQGQLKQHLGVITIHLQEDAHIAALDFDGHEEIAFFGVYDGHGGAQVARFCAMHMPDELLRSPEYKKGEVAEALKATYLAIDDRLRLKENAELLNQLKVKNTSEGSNGYGVIEPIEQDSRSGLHQPSQCCVTFLNPAHMKPAQGHCNWDREGHHMIGVPPLALTLHPLRCFTEWVLPFGLGWWYYCRCS